MTGTVTVANDNPTGANIRRGFWRRRLIDPLVAFLRQGFTPGQLACAMAFGLVCGLFPFIGATTLLTAAAGFAFGLNQPVMQAVNYLLSPVQVIMIPVFVQGGAWLFGADVRAFTVMGMIRVFQKEPLADFLQQFGQAGIYAFVAWLAAAPLLFGAAYLALRPLLARLAASKGREAAR